MVRLAHLSDVHVPLTLTKDWLKRWRAAASKLREQNPDVIVITGDILTAAWPLWRAKQQLEWFANDLAPETLGTAPRIYVPGNHDVNPSYGLGKRNETAAAIFQKVTGFETGWHPPVANLVHIYTVDSNHATWLARGAVQEDDLRNAAIPPTCDNLDHVHIFALHHHARRKQRRLGENPLTTSEDTLGLDDPTRLLSKLAELGYDIVLSGHRHLSSSDIYAEPIAERRAEALWLIGAPSATAANWQGFNLIDALRYGSFKVSAVMQAQGQWLRPHLIASRDYEEARTRRWREQRKTSPTCDVIDVHISNYAEGTPDEQDIQKRCGDVAVTMTIHGPQNLKQHPRLPLPVARIMGYDGSTWRAMSARYTGGKANDPLRIDDDGMIDVSANKGQDIEIKGVLLNALPTRPGDWDRMQASQGTRSMDPFLIEPSISARFLRLRIESPQLLHLTLVARRAGQEQPLDDEDAFFATRDGDSHEGRQEVMIFRPVVGVQYALTLQGVDPVAGAPAGRPHRVIRWQKTVAKFENDEFAPATREAVTAALTVLRNKVIALAAQLQAPGRDHDDISIDLLSVARGLKVVLTDPHTAVYVKGKPRKNPVGVSFRWGQGVAGRALRVNREYTWSQMEHEGHPNTWPAKNWYHAHESISVHEHVYCRPVLTYEGKDAFAIAMLSFASHRSGSSLDDIIKQLRNPTGLLDVRKAFDAAVEEFQDRVNDILSRHHAASGEDYESADY